MAEVTITPLSLDELDQDYSFNERVLLSPSPSFSEFNTSTDNVDFSIFNANKSLLKYNPNFTNYTVTNDYNTNGGEVVSSINIDFEQVLASEGYTQGIFNIVYHFFRSQLGSSPTSKFFIKEISADRTEIRIASTVIDNDTIETLTQDFIAERENEESYFIDFFLNFGNNQFVIANNILLDTSNEEYSVLIKLYQPLSPSIELNTELWVVTETANSLAYNVDIPVEVIEFDDSVKLRGPNTSIEVRQRLGEPTPLENYNSLLDNDLTSSYNQITSLLEEKGIQLSIDYSNFNNFINFSSAKQRLENFYYKVSQIESASNEITALEAGSPPDTVYLSASKASLENQITTIIENFDGFEYYMYYESSSDGVNGPTWPKTNSSPPYTLASTGSTDVLNWYGSDNLDSAYYGGQILSGSEYDNSNPDNLVFAIPEYIREDSENLPYDLFINMIGQHFDVLYSYINDITNKHNADNRLDFGISKDLVADALKSFGIKLYQNNFSSNNAFNALLGINPDGSYLPPTGSEVIDNFITASDSPFPIDDINKEIYKRIYHNTPYLLKKKGSVEGLRALIACFGIPGTILRISEFGGKDRDNTQNWDYHQEVFNYALNGDNVTGSTSLNSNWNSTEPAIAFRFKYDSASYLPDNGSSYTLLELTGGSNLVLNYSQSGYLSASYSGSIPSESKFIGDLNFGTAKVTASFFDGNWWSVLINSGGADLLVADTIYNGNDGFNVGYFESASGNGTIGTDFELSGSLPAFYFQEFRIYTEEIPKTAFLDFTINPFSIEGTNFSSSAETLAFRAPLGSTLDTSSGTLTSIHPKITGSYTSFITNSFSANSEYSIGSNATFTANSEFVYQDQVAVGIKNRVSEKIQPVTLDLPSGDVLSNQISIQQNYPQSQSYTRDVNYVEVAFSPQNEINDDINDSFGHFNIGDYIGDPRLQHSTSSNGYPDLTRLRDEYFEKYYKNYNWTDYINLIKYFDNSLFKMIKDFVPARASLASGVVIKQHLLERSRHRQTLVEQSQNEYSGSIDTAFISGGTGGVMEDFNGLQTSPFASDYSLSNKFGLTQSYTESFDSKEGPVNVIKNTQEEFYDGEFSGSEVLITIPSDTNPFADPVIDGARYNIAIFNQGATKLAGTGYDINNADGDTTFQKYLSEGKGVPTLSGSASFWYERGYQADDDLPVGSITFKVHQTDADSNNRFEFLNNSNGLTVYFPNGPSGGPETHQLEQLSPAIFTPGFPGGGPNNTVDPNHFYFKFNFSPPVGNVNWFDNAGSGNANVFEGFIIPDAIYDEEAGLFVNSDYNPLLNNTTNPGISNTFENYEGLRQSKIFYDVDFNSGILTASNFTAIINESAIKAPVQDSNYTNTGWLNSRYYGTRITSVDFNSITKVLPPDVPTALQSFLLQLQVTGGSALAAGYAQFLDALANTFAPIITNALGKPTVDKKSEYIAVYKEVGDTTPEIINKSQYFINYLIDSEGNISKPSAGEYALENLYQSFEVGDKVRVRTDNGTSLNLELDGLIDVLSIGTITPILISQYGVSASSWTDYLEFEGTTYTGNPGSGGTTGNQTPQYTGIGNINTLNLSDFTQSLTDVTNYEFFEPPTGSNDSSSFAQVAGTYTLNNFDPTLLTSLTFNATLTLTNHSPSNYAQTTVQILQNGTVIAQQIGELNVAEIIDGGDPNDSTDNITSPTTIIVPVSITLDTNNLSNADVFKVRIFIEGYPDVDGFINPQFYDNPTGTFSFGVSQQNPIAEIGLAPEFSDQIPHWESGSSSGGDDGLGNSIITASSWITFNFGNQQITPSASLNFNFNPIRTPFIPQAGDRIRFEYNSEQEYMVYDVILPDDPNNDTGRLCLKLGGQVLPELQMNNFLLYRIARDGQNIQLDYKKENTGGRKQPFTGLIIPQYTTFTPEEVDAAILKLRELDILRN
jgi:hypothetical protein